MIKSEKTEIKRDNIFLIRDKSRTTRYNRRITPVFSATSTSNLHFFSFFELLLILTVLCGVLSLLIPFLKQTTEILRETKCKNFLLQITNANILYATDYGRYAAAEPEDNLRWYGKIKIKGSLIEVFEKDAPLMPYYDFDMKGYMCPELKHSLSPDSKSKQQGGFGYGYNQNIGSLRTKSVLNFWNKYVRNRGIRYKDVKSPGKTVMFADTATKTDNKGDKNLAGKLAEYCFANTFFLINRGEFLKGICDPSLQFRHRGKANIAWVDGHISLENCTYSKDNWYKNNIGFIGNEKENFFDPRAVYDGRKK